MQLFDCDYVTVVYILTLLHLNFAHRNHVNYTLHVGYNRCWLVRINNRFHVSSRKIIQGREILWIRQTIDRPKTLKMMMIQSAHKLYQTADFWGALAVLVIGSHRLHIGSITTMQSAVAKEVERSPYTPVSVDSNPVAADCLLQCSDYNWKLFISHKKHSGSESTSDQLSF